MPGTDAIAVNHDSRPELDHRARHHHVQHGGRCRCRHQRRRPRELPRWTTMSTASTLQARPSGHQRSARLPRHQAHQTTRSPPTTPTAPTMESSYVVSYAVKSNVATIVTRGPMNVVAEPHHPFIGAASACGFSWCTNLSDSALNGPRTVASVVSANSWPGFDVSAPNVLDHRRPRLPRWRIPRSTKKRSGRRQGSGDIAGGATVTGQLGPRRQRVRRAVARHRQCRVPISPGLASPTTGRRGSSYEASYNAEMWKVTPSSDNAWGEGPSLRPGGRFPDAAPLYISEIGELHPACPAGTGPPSGSPTTSSSTTGAGSSSTRTPTGPAASLGNDSLCTLADPSVYTLSSCAAHIPNGRKQGVRPPTTSKNWSLEIQEHLGLGQHLRFFAPTEIGPDCTPTHTCGYNGLFSDAGTKPSGTHNGAWPLRASYPYAGFTSCANAASAITRTTGSPTTWPYCSSAGTLWRSDRVR